MTDDAPPFGPGRGLETDEAEAGPASPLAPAPSGLGPRPPRLRSGWRAFDDMPLVEAGSVTLLDVGAEAGNRLLCRLLADAVARRGEAIVLDGGNWLDVYRLGDCAEAAGRSRLATLEGVRVARGFTAYQLQSLAEDALPAIVAEGGASVGLVLVPSFPEMYLDEDVKRDEAQALATRALGVFRRVAREHDVPVLVTNATLAPSRQHRLRDALDAGVHLRAGLFPAPRGGLRIVVPGFGAVLSPPPGSQQRLLGEFAASEAPTGEFVRRSPDARLKKEAAAWTQMPRAYPPQLKYASKHAGELKWQQRQQAKGAVA